MTKLNFQKKALYEMLANIRGKPNSYCVRMYFYRHNMNILDPIDFMKYATHQRTKKSRA